MFKPVAMLRLSVVVLERDSRTVLRAMGELGAVHLVRIAAGVDTAPLEARDRTADLARCDGLLARAQGIRQSLNLLPPLEEGSRLPGISLTVAEQSLRSLEQRTEALVQRRQQLERECGEACALSDRLGSFQDLEFPLDHRDRFAFLHFAVGIVPVQQLPALESALDGTAVLLPLPAKQGHRPLVVVTSRPRSTLVDNALRQSDFHEEPLPAARDTTLRAVLHTSRLKADRSRAALEQLNAELDSLSADAAQSLEEIESSVRTERRLLEAEQSCPRTDAAVLLTGWISAADAPNLEGRLNEVTGQRCVVRASSAHGLPEEQIPVLLQHSRLLRPFELLVRVYGLPRYGEMSPTLFVALGYLLMFGMMFGDVGHGAVLVAAGLLVRRAVRFRDVGLLLICAGLASALFGAMYGSYFGITQLRHLAFWRDPLEGNPLDLMLVAMGIGVAVISLGLILNIVNRLRHREFAAVFMDKFGLPGVLFYWGGLLLLTNYTALHKAGLAGWALLVFIALPVTAWMLREPVAYAIHRRAGKADVEGGWLTAVAESAVESFEAVLVYLANTVSFVRLAAYAMSHAALLMAAFLMAEAVAERSAAGKWLALFIIILGNVVAIVLEGIIASVQTLRLEYYEFFSKFYPGDGRPFTPFCLGSRGLRR